MPGAGVFACAPLRPTPCVGGNRGRAEVYSGISLE